MSFRDDLYARYQAHPAHDPALPGADDVGPALERYLRGWLPRDLDAPVLDLGCGRGGALAWLAGRGHRRLVGVDRAPDQAALARARVPSAEVVHGDAAELVAARPAAFELVLCFDVLEHLTRDELLSTVRLVRDALRPGGALVVQVPNAASPFAGAVRYGDLTHELGFTWSSLEQLFAACGLSRPEVRECGPVVKGVTSAARVAAWRLLRGLLRAWDAIETGRPGDVYTRVMLARATRA